MKNFIIVATAGVFWYWALGVVDAPSWGRVLGMFVAMDNAVLYLKVHDLTHGEK